MVVGSDVSSDDMVLVADSRLEVVLVVCSARRVLVMVVDIMIKGLGIRYGG